MELEMPDLDGAARHSAILAASARLVWWCSHRSATGRGFSRRWRLRCRLPASGRRARRSDSRGARRRGRQRAAGPRAARELLAEQRGGPARELSEREREILALVAAGHANKVIALRLGISHKTVRNTLSAACRKIGVTDRTQAALWARRSGLV